MSLAIKVLFISMSLFAFVHCKFVKSTSDQLPLCDDVNGTNLDISSSGFTRIGSGFLRSALVTCVNLERNGITEVAMDAFQSCPKLRYLNLASNKLNIEFLGIFESETIETLVLDASFFGRLDAPGILIISNQGNEYDQYDYDYRRRITSTTRAPRTTSVISMSLPHLRHLYLRRSEFDSLEISSHNLPNITHLYLNANKLSSLSFVKSSPKKLTHLFLDHNALSNFAVGSMENLKVLHVDHNPLERLCENEYCNQGISLREAINLEELSLSDINLNTFDEEALEDLRKLKYLDLSQNHISKIPRHALDNLTSLVVLKLNENELTGMPDLCNLIKLQELDLSHNKIQNISQRMFCNFTNLESINLGYNEIIEMTSGVFDMLTSLRVLNLSGNKITTLPVHWFTVGKSRGPLEFINLGGNPLATIPLKSLENLPKNMSIIF